MKQSIKKDGSKHNFNSIYQATDNKFTRFIGGQSDSTLFDAYFEAPGSCFVTLTSKHFLQIGGSGTIRITGSAQETALTRVKLFSYTNQQLFEHGHSRGRIINQAHQVSL